MKPTVALALSGGSDSAVAAHVLLKADYRVFGVHYVLSDSPSARSQQVQAETVARQLGIEFHICDATNLFASAVIQTSREEYRNGRTPNPCVTCNRVVKFGALLDEALALGADAYATGHYARTEIGDNHDTLLRAVDRHADQSYFLYSIERRALAQILFPLGCMHRRDVRAIAARVRLATGEPSQDICFDVRPSGDQSPGNIVNLDGEVVGRHRGLGSFTVGQRRGLGIAEGKPMYVVRIDSGRNQAVVGSEEDLLCKAATLRDVRWLVNHPPSPHQEVQAKTRYRTPAATARIITLGSAAVVIFSEHQRAVAPGQSVVLYDGEIVLGGGVVNTTHARSPL
jgi:tRNA-specific 2-thiouridylase